MRFREAEYGGFVLFSRTTRVRVRMMAVRKTDTEFGGRGGVLPPAEFQVTEDLSAAQLAMLDRQSVPTDPSDDREAVRGRLERRARKNDIVGRR